VALIKVTRSSIRRSLLASGLLESRSTRNPAAAAIRRGRRLKSYQTRSQAHISSMESFAMKKILVGTALALSPALSLTAEDLAPDPFPVTGCYAPENTTCCNALGIDARTTIQCAGVPGDCTPEVVSTSAVQFWQTAVGSGYTPAHFTVHAISADCVFRVPACDTTSPTPACGYLPGTETWTCDNEIRFKLPQGGTDCSGGGPVE